jgi:anoctamin-10/anoctamin-7
VVDKLYKGGLECRLFYSADQEEVFCKVRAPFERLAREADRIDMKVEFDPDRLRTLWEETGVKHPETTIVIDGVETAVFIQKPVVMPLEDPHQGCSFINGLVYGHELPPYVNIFAPFDQDERYDPLYLRANRLDTRDQDEDDRNADREGHFYFREVDRIKILMSIIRTKANPYFGCDLDVPKLLKEKALLGFYPLHNQEAQNWLYKQWMRLDTIPNNQPFDEIKDYFGEKIALYFHWLAEYTTFLCVPGAIGILMAIDEASEKTADTSSAPAFGLMMCAWSTLFLESWKRREAKVALEAGMAGFEDDEESSASVRPQYAELSAKKWPQGKASKITGMLELSHDPMQRARAIFVGILSVCTLTFVALVAVSFIVFAKFRWTQENADGTLTSGLQFSEDSSVAPGFAYGGPLVSAINAIQIIVFGSLYEELATYLNELENHRTDTMYDDNLITKVFSFQFINSYTTMFYTAFLKSSVERRGGPFVPMWLHNSTSDLDDIRPQAGCHAFETPKGTDEGRDGACMNELSNLLATIFITRLVIGNIQEVVVPWIKAKKTAFMETRGSDKPASVAEQQYFLADYDAKGLFGDYMEMILQFGYATMFVTAYPLAPLLAVLNNYIEIRVDAFKLLTGTRRPEPKGAEDIGTWQYILEIMSTASVISNSLLICFTGSKLTELCNPDEHNICQDLPMHYTLLYWRLALFVVLEHVFMFFKTGLGLAIPDIPEDVALQRQRNDNFVAKIVRLEVDEADDDDGDMAMSTTKMKIFASDEPASGTAPRQVPNPVAVGAEVEMKEPQQI